MRSMEQREGENNTVAPKRTYTEIETLQPTKGENRAFTQNRISIFFEVTLLIFAVLAFLQIIFVPKELNNAFDANIKETVVMSASRQEKNDNKYQHWEKNTFDDSGVQIFNFYIFNITNPHEVLDGAIPQLDEIGPFVYRRFEFKEGVEFAANSCTVNYRYEFSFVYEEEMTLSENSIGLNETVTILNPGMLTFFNTMNFASYALTPWATYFNSLPGMQLFYQRSVHDIIFGVYDEGLVKLSGKSPAETTYSLLNQASMNVVERTGYCNRNDLRLLEKIWNTSNVSFWASPGEAIFPSRETRNWPWKSVSKSDDLLAWHLPFSRKVNYTFDQEVSSNGLALWKFKLSEDTLKNATNYPYNAHYYAFGHDGLLNFTVRKPVPQQTLAYLSFPHFYQGDYYVKEIGEATGMNPPDPEVDGTYFELEPQTGIVLKNWLAFQTNFQLFPLMENISYLNTSGDFNFLVTNFSNLRSFIVPMGYQIINAYAPSDVVGSLATSLNLMQQLKDTSFYGGISFGVVMVALSVWLICRRLQKRVIEENVTPEEEVSMTRSNLEY